MKKIVKIQTLFRIWKSRKILNKMLVPYRAEKERRRNLVRDRIVIWLRQSDALKLTWAFETFKIYVEKSREHEKLLAENARYEFLETQKLLATEAEKQR